MKLRMFMFAAVCLFSLSVFALPDYPMWTIYYDETGNEVGYRSLNCAGRWSSSGTTNTENYSVEYGEPCHNEVELITCPDVGLVTYNGGTLDRCVSEGFNLWCTFNPSSPSCSW
jgi:hypothetical protein